ncbi:MAG: copper amine oxidase N-terminal domain-containing protein [Armatimonadetes bacterium]|nr:copper amine oxidase N-terminal domain-containing protein [Armatimonadota bacterium]
MFAWAVVVGMALGAVPLWKAGSEAQAQWVKVREWKQCGHCRREVPMSSRAGMHCPHCGAYWKGEDEICRYLTEPGAEKPSRVPRLGGPTVTIRYGDETFKVPAKTVGGTLMVPVRTFEKLGAVVEQTSDGIVIGLDETVLRLWPGKRTYEVCEGEVCGDLLPVAPRMVSGSLYVPLRAIAEALGFSVDWEGSLLVAE